VHRAEDLVDKGDGIAIFLYHTTRWAVRHQTLRMHTAGIEKNEKEKRKKKIRHKKERL